MQTVRLRDPATDSGTNAGNRKSAEWTRRLVHSAVIFDGAESTMSTTPQFEIPTDVRKAHRRITPSACWSLCRRDFMACVISTN